MKETTISILLIYSVTTRHQ